MPKIIVHEKALAHLSRGLYRSPASALRELVSNAWDANATLIRINTNYPNFYQLTIEDNGDGFTENNFVKLMTGNIGNSDKRAQKTELKYNRPVIGRLGIGMLGIAQICGKFKIVSKPKKGKGFLAVVNLYDLLKENLDKDDSEIVHEEEIGKEIDIGTYDLEEFDPDAWEYGTTIMAEDIHPTFIKSFQESLKYEEFKDPSLDWSDNLRILSKVHTLQQLGDYWRLLWELAAACPVPYLGVRALPGNLIKYENSLLEKYSFSVIVDGIKLFKPVYLKNNPHGYTTIKVEPTQLKIYDKLLNFHGYIIVQEGKQLKPDELRGIMIRIKNIGIGYYDQTMLDYRSNEGPRSRWLTGEIFVDEGLENALNIDRDSFNRFHPEFRALQKHIHSILKKNIFPKVYQQIDVRSKERAQEKETLRSTHLRQLISKRINKRIKIKTVQKEEKSEKKAKVKIEKKPNQVILSIPSQEDIKTKKPHKQLATSILAIFEISMQEKTKKEQRELFSILLFDLLSKW